MVIAGRRQNIPSLGFVRLSPELVDLPTQIGDLVAAGLFGIERGDHWVELLFDLGDSFASGDETFLGRIVLLAF
jgi:hypothetical protein